MPAKKKSAKGDAEFDKFYADLKGAGVALRGGEDYNWGRNHKRAYKKLLCKMDAGYKTPESIISASDEELLTIPGVGISFIKKLRKSLGRI